MTQTICYSRRRNNHFRLSLPPELLSFRMFKTSAAMIYINEPLLSQIKSRRSILLKVDILNHPSKMSLFLLQLVLQMKALAGVKRADLLSLSLGTGPHSSYLRVWFALSEQSSPVGVLVCASHWSNSGLNVRTVDLGKIWGTGTAKGHWEFQSFLTFKTYLTCKIIFIMYLYLFLLVL